MKPVHIIGMGMSPGDLTPAHDALIRGADLLVGGRRHLDSVPGFSGTVHELTGDLKSAVAIIRERMPTQSVVVLASGDPLFYGVGAYLARALGPDKVVVHPNVSSVAAAFSRLKLPWQEARVVSLHGRDDIAPLLEAMDTGDTVVVFTDPVRSPAWLARTLTARGATGFRMRVFERMGYPDERVTASDLEAAAEGQFSEPNLVVLLKEAEQAATAPLIGIGMPEEGFEHERGLITKAEVRAVTLSKLQLAPGHTLWDLGAGSGAVSVEACGFVTAGRVIAVEKNAARIRLIEANRRRFGAHRLEIVHAELPGGLSELPRPDRVFIGGGGRDLPAIITAAADRLAPDGIIVINTVIVAGVTAAMETLNQLGFRAEIVQVQISRGRPMPWGERLKAENPVFVIRGTVDASSG